MEAQGWLMLKLLLNRYHQGSDEALSKFLPDREKELFETHTTQSSDIGHLLAKSEDVLAKFHPSWLSFYCEEVTEEMRSLILASLPDKLRKAVSSLLKEHNVKPSVGDWSIQPWIRSFFLDFLLHEIKRQGILPVEFLPRSPLFSLLDVSFDTLLEVIDYLALPDLAKELKHVLAKDALEKIYQTLSPKKQHYTRACLHHIESVDIPEINLKGWDGEKETLDRALHYRGLLRFAMALSGQHPDFVWHIRHRLDKGRGEFLKKHVSENEIPGTSEAMKSQVTHVLGLIKS